MSPQQRSTLSFVAKSLCCKASRTPRTLQTLSRSCWQSCRPRVKRTSVSFNHGTEHSACKTRQRFLLYSCTRRRNNPTPPPRFWLKYCWAIWTAPVCKSRDQVVKHGKKTNGDRNLSNAPRNQCRVTFMNKHECAEKQAWSEQGRQHDSFWPLCLLKAAPPKMSSSNGLPGSGHRCRVFAAGSRTVDTRREWSSAPEHRNWALCRSVETASTLSAITFKTALFHTENAEDSSASCQFAPKLHKRLQQAKAGLRCGSLTMFSQSSDNSAFLAILPSEGHSTELQGIHTGDDLVFVPNWVDELPFFSMAIHLLNSSWMPIRFQCGWAFRFRGLQTTQLTSWGFFTSSSRVFLLGSARQDRPRCKLCITPSSIWKTKESHKSDKDAKLWWKWPAVLTDHEANVSSFFRDSIQNIFRHNDHKELHRYLRNHEEEPTLTTCCPFWNVLPLSHPSSCNNALDKWFPASWIWKKQLRDQWMSALPPGVWCKWYRTKTMHTAHADQTNCWTRNLKTSALFPYDGFQHNSRITTIRPWRKELSQRTQETQKANSCWQSTNPATDLLKFPRNIRVDICANWRCLLLVNSRC